MEPNILNEATTLLWRKYLAAESLQVRPSTMAALNCFIEALLAHDASTWHAWACDLAAQSSEARTRVPVLVRQPLFNRVIVPALTLAIEAEQPGSARTLAFFAQLLPHAPLPEPLSSPWQLLREALRVDPLDVLARTRLVEIMERQLKYCIHELPAGVLWDANSASASQCDVLRAELVEFRNHLKVLQRELEYDELCRTCELHFTAYREYLLHGRGEGSYEQFLLGRSPHPDHPDPLLKGEGY